MSSNVVLAAKVIESLTQQGMSCFVLCPGSRNSPLILTLDRFKGVETISHFDERAAGFYALGRSCRLGAPVAVVVTSGTAVSELYSSVIEAHFQKRGLVVISADRPREYAMTGAPQSIDQTEIFGRYADYIDISSVGDIERIQLSDHPLHINVPFDEPLIDGEIIQGDFSDEIFQPDQVSPTAVEKKEPKIAGTRPVIIVSGMGPSEADQIIDRLASWECPMWVEATSGLMNHPQLQKQQLKSPEQILQLINKSEEIDCVLRIGDVPTCRFWRDMESSALPIYSFTDKGWSGLARNSMVFSMASFSKIEGSITHPNFEAIASADQRCFEQINGLIDGFPGCEAAFVRTLAERSAADQEIYLGNSLPIRHWDSYSRGHNHRSVWANRGVNGIDGQIASFFGFCEPQKNNMALIGDLTAMYDLNALCFGKLNQNWQLVVLNNGGGKIFSRLYSEEIFQNPHQYQLNKLSSFFDIPMRALVSASELNSEFECGLLELMVNDQQEREFNLKIRQVFQEVSL